MRYHIQMGVLSVFFLLAIGRGSAFASNVVHIGKYIIPDGVSQALKQGMTIPVFLRYRGDNTTEPKQKSADALIAIEGESLYIRDINPIEQSNGAQLSENTASLLSGLKDRKFGQDLNIVISPEAELRLNIRSFVLTLDVSKKGLSTRTISRNWQLPESSVQKGSSILNYDVGIYKNQVKKGTSTSNSYLNLDDTIGFKEHHLNFGGAFYGVGKGNQESRLTKAMYERDVNGYRLAMGFFDSWSLQSIGNLTALNSSKIYGVSYGNKSSTNIKNNKYSITPITVFLQSAGEVHIVRDGRLLSIQNFPMGSFEVDTSHLPYGIYDVDVEVYVDGKLRFRTRKTINKAFENHSGELNQLAWQLYSGTVEYQKHIERTDDYDQPYRLYGNKYTYLAGISSSITIPLMSGLTLQSTNYTFDGYFVDESSANLLFSDYGSLGWQGMISQAGRYRNIVNASFSLPRGYGSLWVNHDKSHMMKEFPIYDTDTYSYGTTLNLNGLINRAGVLTVSHTLDHRAHNNTNNIEYSTSLFSGRYGTVNLRAGIERYQYDYQSNSSNDKYVSIDISIPLSTWLTTGVTSNNGRLKANIAASKNFDNSAITSAGMTISRLYGDSHYGNDSRYALSGFSTFDTKYSSGTLSLSRPDNRELNGNLTARGSLAYSDHNISGSGYQDRSGVIIHTGIDNDAVMSAQINGRMYRLSGKRNFIPLPPYATYDVELMNDKNSMDSFDIISERSKKIILYPGNVAVYTPHIKQLVTVFGKMRSMTGQVIANTEIHNHIGRTVTDGNGQFSMDIDKSYPVISVDMPNGGVCESELDLNNTHGVKWLGDILCEQQNILAER